MAEINSLENEGAWHQVALSLMTTLPYHKLNSLVPMSIILSVLTVNNLEHNTPSQGRKDLLDITGIVLAGGKSSRFGRNKSAELLLSKSLLERVTESMAKVCNPILIVTGADSVTPVLPSHYNVNSVRDLAKANGPLQGLRSGLLYSDSSYNFVASCDMPFLEVK